MKRVMLMAAGVAAVCVGLAGCATPRGPFSPAPDYIPVEHYPKITTTAHLSQYLVFSPPTVVQDGVMRVTTPVRLVSRPGEWSKVQYRYIFLDKHTVPVTVQPDWQSQTLEPQQQVFLQGNSMDSNAVDWRLEIRPHR